MPTVLAEKLHPPHVTMYRQIIRENMTICYAFFHEKFGTLGQIYFKPVSSEGLHQHVEVAGAEGAPMTETRKELLLELGRLMPSEIERIFGKGDSKPPAIMQNRSSLIESKLLVCLDCDAPVALLIFANNTPKPSEGNAAPELEDYACLMHPKIVECNLPTWIIGDSEELKNDVGYAWVLNIWPKRQEAKPTRSDELNQLFEMLQTQHCKNQ